MEVLPQLRGGYERGDNVRIVKYHADATGVTWFAIRDKNFTTPWCMSLISAIIDWISCDVDEVTE